MIDIRKCIRRLVEGGAYRHIVEADNSGTESRRWSCSTTLQKTLLQERWPGSQSHDSHDSHGQIERKNIKMRKKQWKRSANRKDLMIWKDLKRCNRFDHCQIDDSHCHCACARTRIEPGSNGSSDSSEEAARCCLRSPRSASDGM